MISKTLFTAAIIAAVSFVPSALAAGFIFELGVGHADLSDGEYSLSSLVPNTDPAANTVAATIEDPTLTEDDSTTVPYLAAGYTFNDWFQTRLAYQQFGRTTARSVADVVITGSGANSGQISMAYSDKVRVLSFAPEFRWRVSGPFTLTIAPELNWVFSDAALRTSTTSPAITIVPLISRKSDELTLGVSVGAAWTLSDRLSLVARYHYQDLDVGWKREAQVFSGGLQWKF